VAAFEELEILVRPVLDQMGIDLVELRLLGKGPRTILRLYIEESGGISLDRCAEASRRISELLDRKEPIPGRYVLEVSSPGVDRPLKTARDFLRNVNRRVEITLSDDGSEKRLQGVIRQVEGERVQIESEKRTMNLGLGEIFSARVLLDV
jgi:ribosome maturation factor RimP